jgi:SAM-dependent methyltransferase
MMPTDWEELYQRGETPWDKGAPSPGLIDYLAEHPVHGRGLVPGCGTGHDVRALAQTAHQVIGIDVAPSAITAAQRLSSGGAAQFMVADLFALSSAMQGSFDWVWEHTCFSAIDPARRSDYVAAVASALKPRGELLAIFYLDPGNQTPDEGPPFEVSVAELDRLFLPRFELVREWVPERAYPGREGRELMRIHLLRA